MRRGVVVVVVVGTALSAAGLAAARTSEQQAVIDTTVRFLQERQRADGGFAEPGGEPSQGTDAWVNMALAAAGENPQDQVHCGGETAWIYLERHFREGLEEEEAWPETATTAFERELLAVDAAGSDPHGFAGYDLVREILARRLPDGSFAHVPGGEAGANDTIFAILALSPVHEPEVEATIATAREWVVGAEDEDGGWYYSGPSTVSEVDMTGAALEALAAAGPPPGGAQLAAYDRAVEGGLDYLHRSQLPDGGFPALPTSEAESNVASTAWAVQAIWALGGNPEDWKVGTDGREPLDYMESMQQPDGHIRWRASTDLNGIWMTAYVTPAFAGQALPIDDPGRPEAALPGAGLDCEEPGDGGEDEAPGEGVETGGGGHRAPAFSRPKAGSRGRTPGGARLVRGEGLEGKPAEPVNHSPHRRRGANVEQARGTETVEPRRAAAADQEVEEVAAGPAGTDDSGSGGDGGGEHRGSSERGAPAAPTDPPRVESARGGEAVSGVVIGSRDRGEDGSGAFGAPGLHGSRAGSGEGSGGALAIGAAALLAALLGVGWERRRGVAA
jgi:prenyltransferase beta subunit